MYFFNTKCQNCPPKVSCHFLLSGNYFLILHNGIHRPTRTPLIRELYRLPASRFARIFPSKIMHLRSLYFSSVITHFNVNISSLDGAHELDCWHVSGLYPGLPPNFEIYVRTTMIWRHGKISKNLNPTLNFWICNCTSVRAL